MALKLLVVTGSEPVSVAEAKIVARVDSDITADDSLFTVLIKAARAQAEQILCRTITEAQYERSLDAFPDGGIQLAWPHVTAINSLQYVDAAGDLQTWDGSNYTLDAREHPGWVLPVAGMDWPDTLDTANAVRVVFTVNWIEGGTGAVPDDVRAWIKLRVATMYKFREQVASGVSISEMPRSHVDGLLDRWMVWS